jgi:predicted nucleic acid-binding protein
MSVALDTMTLIWGISSPGNKAGNPRQSDLLEMQCRARILIDQLEQDNATILIPAIVVAEVLCGVQKNDQGAFLAELTRRFFCPSFDLRASELAAQLWLYHRGLPKTDQQKRTVIKSDVLIIANAKVAGARTFYTNDTASKKLAKYIGMDGKDLPIKHADMFRDAEIRARLGLGTNH